jgi:hypothetical protein
MLGFKPCSLLVNIRLGCNCLKVLQLINFGRKHYYNTGPWAQCYETFYGRNLRYFVISLSVCLWEAFPTYYNVCE